MDVRYFIKAFLLFFLLNACNKKDKIYSENGVLLREENYDNDGLLHGITIHYFETGQIKAKIPFNHVVRDGKEIVYDSIGNVKIIYTHNNGILDTMKFYSIPGKLTSLIYLKDSNKEPQFTSETKFLSIEHHSVCNLRCDYCSEIY